MITRAIVRNGLRNGSIQLVQSPNGDGIVCKIGDYWFYFGGSTAEEYDDPQKYTTDVGFVVIARDIYEALEDFRAEGKGGTNWDEYCYYEAILTGRKKKKGARWATNLLDNYESGYVSKGLFRLLPISLPSMSPVYWTQSVLAG